MAFELPAGKVTVLLGRNGVGKTTLLRTLMGLVPASRQRQRSPAGTSPMRRPDERARAGIGYVPQGREIFARPHGGGEPGDGPRHARARRAALPARIFEMFPVLRRCRAGAAATSRAASSSSSPSAARSPWGRSC